MWAKTTSSRDNWERLVAAVIKRDQIRQLCHQDSISTVDSDLSDRTLSLRSVASAASPQLSLARNSTVEARKGGSGIITQKLVSALLWWNKPKGFDLDAISVVAEASSVNESYDDGSPVGQIPAPPILRVFTFSEGGFGKVYKGFLDSKNRDPGSVIAVKKLNSEITHGFQEWQSEVDFLGRISHSNLIKLLGYCREDKELLLVYEFMQKGSLENHLFGRGARIQPLPWDTRLKIAIGAARGLAFLHKSDINVIYRDFKASSILLDGVISHELTSRTISIFALKATPVLRPRKGKGKSIDPPKLKKTSKLRRDLTSIFIRDKASNPSPQTTVDSEFSDSDAREMQVLADAQFAKQLVVEQFQSQTNEHEHEFTYEHGDNGGYKGHLYVKSDVYGFGVVLVEMLTGLRAFDKNRPPKQHFLTEWTKPYLQGRRKLRVVMDSRLEGKYPSKSALKIAQLALNCVELEPRKRPSMQEIVETLEAIDAADERPRADRSDRPPVHQKQDNRAYPPPPQV